ncbi:unnamed protein product [Polarella glacialis]|nr:unnamed protein product [Polarella glacialis]
MNIGSASCESGTCSESARSLAFPEDETSMLQFKAVEEQQDDDERNQWPMTYGLHGHSGCHACNWQRAPEKSRGVSISVSAPRWVRRVRNLHDCAVKCEESCSCYGIHFSKKCGCRLFYGMPGSTVHDRLLSSHPAVARHVFAHRKPHKLLWVCERKSTTMTTTSFGFTCPGKFTKGPGVRFKNFYFTKGPNGDEITVGLGDLGVGSDWAGKGVRAQYAADYNMHPNFRRQTLIAQYVAPAVAPVTLEQLGFVEGAYVGGPGNRRRGPLRYGQNINFGGVGDDRGSIVYAKNSCQSGNCNPSTQGCFNTSNADSRPRGNCFDVDKVTTLEIQVRNNACNVGSFLVFQNIMLSIANQNLSLPDVGPVNVKDCGPGKENATTICYTFAGLMDGWTVSGEANRGNISGCLPGLCSSEGNSIEVSVIQAPPSTYIDP